MPFISAMERLRDRAADRSRISEAREPYPWCSILARGSLHDRLSSFFAILTTCTTSLIFHVLLAAIQNSIVSRCHGEYVPGDGGTQRVQ